MVISSFEDNMLVEKSTKMLKLFFVHFYGVVIGLWTAQDKVFEPDEEEASDEEWIDVKETEEVLRAGTQDIIDQEYHPLVDNNSIEIHEK